MRLKTGSATVPVAPVGVPPTGNGRSRQSLNRDSFGGGHVFGETPNTATETVALPILTASLRLGEDAGMSGFSKLFHGNEPFRAKAPDLAV